VIVKHTIAVGLSGGIDSAMTCYILKERGHNLIGLTMSTWDETYTSQKAVQSGCFGPGEKEDIESAQKICELLDIPHYVIDLKTEYKKTVLDYFRRVYLSGRTPNPCVLCNREIKFGILPIKAKELGLNFDHFATGHYARIIKKSNTYYLIKGIDETKDQSYFLCRLTQDHLASTILPLGNYYKSDVKDMARETGLNHLVQRKESQDFIETEDYGFIFGKEGSKPGKIIDEDGKVLGQHRGLIYYTVGQRKGLNISGLPEPYYVLGIDACKNVVIVGTKNKLYHSELIATDVLWSDGIERKENLKLEAKIRLQHKAARCEVMPLEDNSYHVVFERPQLSITPGQIIAFYDDDIVLGGGIIDRVNS